MAEACGFDEANTSLGPPAGMTEDQVQTLRVLRAVHADGQPVVISCFKLTAEELAEVNRTGRVWLGVLGTSMPPVWVLGTKPFETKEPS